MQIQDIIKRKLKGNSLSYDELKYFIKGVVDNSVSDFQISSLITAMYINGLDDEELINLTHLMAYSGKTFDFTDYDYVVDKHSSGGVGDKVTLIYAPLMASLGVKVPKMSGKGLGYTGGTIDKLESIPGFNTSISSEDFINILNKVGCVISSQTDNFCYADKKIYTLRDLTGTVDNIELIASSIMSKKIAMGAKNIILDVKCGDGAFMKDVKSAKQLARKMITIGKGLNKNISVFITDMNEPLGYNIGNSLEVIEALEVLKGKYIKGLSELVLNMSAQSLLLCGKEKDFDKALEMSKEKLNNNEALLKFKEMVKAQGGDIAVFDDYNKLEKGIEYKVFSDRSGYISKIDAENIGRCTMLLGGGRKSKEDKIDYGAGIILCKKLSDKVEHGELLGTLYFSKKTDIDYIEKMFLSSFKISDKIPFFNSIIIDKMT